LRLRSVAADLYSRLVGFDAFITSLSTLVRAVR
jgi:hypothetical protein